MRTLQTTLSKLLLLLPLLTAAACAHQPAMPLPTLAAAAAVPQSNFGIGLPATYTPEATLPAPTASPAPLPTAADTATPPPPTAAPLPAAAPQSALPIAQSVPDSTRCDGSGYLYRGQFPSASGWRRYTAYLPPCYRDDGRGYPVLYLFHGSIQTESHWTDLGLARLIDAGIADGRYPPFIVLMPYNGEIGNMTSGNDHSIEGITVNGLIPYVDSSFCSWPQAAGRAIGGISRGGYWALEIAFRHPWLFSAVSGHSSHLRLETDSPDYNPLVTYAQQDLSGLRIWMDWGEEDFLRPGQEQLHNSLTQAGIGHQAIVNPGGHSDSYWAAHLREYLDWHTAGWPRDRLAYPPCQN